jgi:hypothetical protein
MIVPLRLRALALLVFLVPGGACASRERRPPELHDSDYPGLVRAPSVLPDDVLWRQHVTATWGEQDAHGFDAALQKQGDVLTLIGLTPLGSAGFVLVLRGERLEFENRTGDELPIPPRFILLDVQRVFFPWLGPPGGALDDGEHAGLMADERVVERWQGGRLVERRFTRTDGQPQGEITVRYTWDQPGWIAPTRAIVDNGWFGYRLVVETSEETRLPSASAPSAP